MTNRKLQLVESYPIAEQTFSYRLAERDGVFVFEIDGDSPDDGSQVSSFAVDEFSRCEGAESAPRAGQAIFRNEANESFAFSWAWVGSDLHLWIDGNLFVFRHDAPSAGQQRGRGRSGPSASAPGDITAPMPGTVLDVLVAEGDAVERNQTLMVLESMKMELLIAAPRNGIVRRVSVQPGQQVERGMRLLELAPEEVPPGVGHQ